MMYNWTTKQNLVIRYTGLTIHKYKLKSRWHVVRCWQIPERFHLAFWFSLRVTPWRWTLLPINNKYPNKIYIKSYFCRYLGILSASQPTMRELETKEDTVNMCSNMKFLAPKQRQLCKESNERRLLEVISNGASFGIDECKFQFSTRRWNCSTFNSTDVFGGILRKSVYFTIFDFSNNSKCVSFSLPSFCG